MLVYTISELVLIATTFYIGFNLGISYSNKQIAKKEQKNGL
jgi:hypothetical protein